ncbi:MAG TPA: peptidase M61 [Aquimonas sp.]|nr:M61 family metallopeptidase [Xanthomonadales bacterium]HRF54603.1 peptidase M61 [Aquimonas sp.]
MSAMSALPRAPLALALGLAWLASAPSRADDRPLIQLQVDASDLARRIQHVRLQMPVQPGPLRLWYPRWIPGNHAPTGPINQIAGLRLSAGGQGIAWTRDDTDMYAFDLVVPPGAQTLDIEFDYLSPTASDQGRVAMTQDMLSLQWHRVLMYPAEMAADAIRVEARLRLPAEWSYGTALTLQSVEQGELHFAPQALVDLVDSPVYAGRHFRRFELDQGNTPVALNVMADEPEQLLASAPMLDAHCALVKEADAVFGVRPFAHYDFLLALSDTFSGIGLEHHQSSENGTYADYLRGEGPFIDNDLLPHEYVHAWVGKYRRPVGTFTPHYNTPMRNGLLWVYEGQTQYWAVVLAARSGLWTSEQTQEVLAQTVANYETRKGRQWRSLHDTVHQGIVDFNDLPQAWGDWQRGFDFYAEGSLLWLAVDAEIRQLSKGRRSLDDVAKAFYAGGDSSTRVSQFTEDDVFAALQAVQPGDWPAFIESRLDAVDAPLDGLEKAGWRIIYNEQPNLAIEDAESAGGYDDYSYSLGLSLDDEGLISSVVWQSPAFVAGLAKDTQVVAVNGRAYSASRLERAIRRAQQDRQPIELLLRQDDHYRHVQINYHDGLRYPHLQRIDGSRDWLTSIVKARR